jgi:serine protease Do
MKTARRPRRQYLGIALAAVAILLATLAPAAAAAAAPADSTADTTARVGFADLLRAEDAMIYVAEEDAVPGEFGFGQTPGFLISADGLALVPGLRIVGTQTHFVWVGDADEPVAAEFVAADECLDLALIDLEGGDYPFLEFGDPELARGGEVYGPIWSGARARYELIDGVVESLDNPGNTTGLSVPGLTRYQTAENTARFGPVVNEDGEVVGLAGGSMLDEDVEDVQTMVPLDAVLPVLAGLLDGENGAWLGLSSWASNPFWMWVSGISVDAPHPESPAAATGLEDGDVILDLSGQAMSADGTKRAYCEILRAADPDEPIPITVYREATGELLAGEVYGEPLEFTGTLDDYVAPVLTLADGDVTNDLIGRPLAVDWRTLYSPDGNMKLEMPADWELESDRDGDSVMVHAAPDLTRFNRDRGDNPVGGAVTGVTVAVHEIGDTTDAGEDDLALLAQDRQFQYDELDCRSGYSGQRPYPSPAIPEYWVTQDWYCDDGIRITEIVGISRSDPGLAIVTSLVMPNELTTTYEWIAWSARGPDEPMIAPGWRRHTLPDDSLSIGVPPGWTAVDAGSDPDAEGTGLLDEQNVFVSVAEVDADGEDDSVLVLITRNPIDEDLLALLPELDAEWMAETTLPTLEALNGLVGEVAYEIVTLPFGEAVRYDYQLEIGSGASARIADVVQYAFMADNEVFALTFMVLADDPEFYATTIVTMAASFAIPEPVPAGLGISSAPVEKDAAGRPVELGWQEIVTEFGDFAFEAPEDWELRIRSGGSEQGVWASPDLDGFIDEIYETNTVTVTGASVFFRSAGDTSDYTNAELLERAESLLFDESELVGCGTPTRTSTMEISAAIPDLWAAEIYDCDGGYVKANLVGITRSETGHTIAFSIQATPEEMGSLTWIPDSVRQTVVRGAGPDQSNLAAFDSETQVLMVGESGAFAVVIPVDMGRNTWFVQADGEGDHLEEFSVSPQLDFFIADRIVDPPRASIPGIRIGIVDADFLVGLDDADLTGRLANVVAQHRKPEDCLELSEDVINVKGAPGRFLTSSRLCGTRYVHVVMAGAISVAPGYLIIIDVVATVDTDELEILLNIVDSLRLVEVVDPAS